MRPDVVIVGGGLAGGLIAWRLAERRPEVSVAIIEAGPCFGGNHTWSFHETDLSASERAFIEPFIEHRWSEQTVRFPGRTRKLASGYASVTSDRFHAVLNERLANRVRFNTRAEPRGPGHVQFDSGSGLAAGVVIDARGLAPVRHLALGFQKFLGLELQLSKPVAPAAPIIMDATAGQDDGYRFVYTLPFAPDRVLVEDTRYADRPTLDRAALRRSVLAYAASQGWAVDRVVREESGILPIVLSGNVEALWAATGGVPTAGLAGGFFHPTTGYSLPDAVRLADVIAGLPVLAPEPVFKAVRAQSVRLWRERAFFRLVNRLLFLAGEPANRWRVMDRFYRLPDPLIERFYAGRPTLLDKAQILTGKPPVPMGEAIRALSMTQLHRRPA
jgi:lycopene beta-cyclase